MNVSERPGTVPIQAFIPITLRDRCRVVGKKIRKTISDMVRDALFDRVEALEARIRADEQQRVADREAKRTHRRENPLAPKNAPLGPDVRRPIGLQALDPIEEICGEFAPKIAEAIQDEVKRKAFISEALAKVRAEMPLTHPSDATILAVLERAVVRWVKEKPPKEQLPSEEASPVDFVLGHDEEA